MAHRKENDVMSERFSHIKDNVLTMEIEWEHVKSSWELYKREFELSEPAITKWLQLCLSESLR